VAKRNKVSRDRQGRWVKGTSGNPNGRPHKYAKIDFGNLEQFKNFALEVKTSDGPVVMTREAAVQHRLYQSAMQGNVHAQIFLARRFEKFAENIAEVSAKFNDLVSRLREEKREPTLAESLWLHSAQVLMHERPQPKSTFVRTGKHRSRRKPKRKDGESDPSVKS